MMKNLMKTTYEIVAETVSDRDIPVWMKGLAVVVTGVCAGFLLSGSPFLAAFAVLPTIACVGGWIDAARLLCGKKAWFSDLKPMSKEELNQRAERIANEKYLEKTLKELPRKRESFNKMVKQLNETEHEIEATKTKLIQIKPNT